MAQPEKPEPLEQATLLWRGFRGRCPGCGTGRLFKTYLKQVDHCPHCGADFSNIHADDGPAWFVMVLAGAIVVPSAIALSLHTTLPDWAALILLVIIAIAGTLLLLPRVKGVFIALLWRLEKPKVAGRRAEG